MNDARQPHSNVLALEAINVRIGNPPADVKMGPEEGNGILIVARIDPNDVRPLGERELVKIGQVDIGDNRKVPYRLNDAIAGNRVKSGSTRLTPGEGIKVPVTVAVGSQGKDATIQIKSFDDLEPESILEQLTQIEEIKQLIDLASSLNRLKTRFENDATLSVRINKRLRASRQKMLSAGGAGSGEAEASSESHT